MEHTTNTLDLDYQYLLNDHMKQKLHKKNVKDEKKDTFYICKNEYTFYKKRIWKITKNLLNQFNEIKDTTIVKDNTIQQFETYIHSLIHDMKDNDRHYLIQKEMKHIDEDEHIQPNSSNPHISPNPPIPPIPLNPLNTLYTIYEEDGDTDVNTILIQKNMEKHKTKNNTNIYKFVKIKNGTNQENESVKNYPKNINETIDKKLKSKKIKKRGLLKKSKHHKDTIDETKNDVKIK